MWDWGTIAVTAMGALPAGAAAGVKIHQAVLAYKAKHEDLQLATLRELRENFVILSNSFQAQQVEVSGLREDLRTVTADRARIDQERADLARDVARERELRQALAGQVETLATEKSAMQVEIRQYRDQLKAQEEEIGRLTALVEAKDEQIVALNARVDSLRGVQGTLTDRMDTLRGDLEQGSCPALPHTREAGGTG
jgi:chromosome segregation ATPase